MIHAKLDNISIDSRDEKLFENSILKYSQGLLGLENVILGDLFFFNFLQKFKFPAKKLETLGRTYIWLYKLEKFLSQGKIKPNAFFLIFLCF